MCFVAVMANFIYFVIKMMLFCYDWLVLGLLIWRWIEWLQRCFVACFFKEVLA